MRKPAMPSCAVTRSWARRFAICPTPSSRRTRISRGRPWPPSATASFMPISVSMTRSCSPRLMPVEDFGAVPVQGAGVAVDVIVDGFEVFDAVRLAADIGVDRDRHDLGAFFALLIQPVEGVDAAPGEVFRFMVLHEHHRDVVE